MELRVAAARNLDALRSNPYPGRGLVLGQAADGRTWIQLYWIMGRSANSRNRRLVSDGRSVRTAAVDPALLADPSLVIYRAMGVEGDAHAVSNGAQTDAILAGARRGADFADALGDWTFEPDAPNYTPRISGLMRLGDARAYHICLLRAVGADPARGVRAVWSYERAWPGFGHCVTTYAGDGTPLPSFEGEPLAVPLDGGVDDLARTFWQALHPATRLGLAVKTIDGATGATGLRIVNLHRDPA